MSRVDNQTKTAQDAKTRMNEKTEVLNDIDPSAQ